MTQIGIITNNETGIFQKAVIKGIQATAQEQKILLEIVSLEHRPLPDPLTFDGLIIIANPLPNEKLQALYESQIPISLVSHQVPNVPIPTLMFNHAQGIALLVKHLVVNCGRRHLVFVRGIPEQLDARQREAAFRREVMRHELDIMEDYFIQGDFDPATASRSLEAFFQQGLPFDAILASDFVMAQALTETLTKLGLKVPQEVSVVGFGDDTIAEIGGITTVAANVEELGQRAIRQLMSQLNGLPIRGVTTLSVQLVVRSSCGYQG